MPLISWTFKVIYLHNNSTLIILFLLWTILSNIYILYLRLFFSHFWHFLLRISKVTTRHWSMNVMLSSMPSQILWEQVPWLIPSLYSSMLTSDLQCAVHALLQHVTQTTALVTLDSSLNLSHLSCNEIHSGIFSECVEADYIYIDCKQHWDTPHVAHNWIADDSKSHTLSRSFWL